MAEQWDVVVVGSGHNGLVAAGYLAVAGKRVCVLGAGVIGLSAALRISSVRNLMRPISFSCAVTLCLLGVPSSPCVFAILDLYLPCCCSCIFRRR